MFSAKLGPLIPTETSLCNNSFTTTGCVLNSQSLNVHFCNCKNGPLLSDRMQIEFNAVCHVQYSTVHFIFVFLPSPTHVFCFWCFCYMLLYSFGSLTNDLVSTLNAFRVFILCSSINHPLRLFPVWSSFWHWTDCLLFEMFFSHLQFWSFFFPFDRTVGTALSARLRVMPVWYVNTIFHSLDKFIFVCPVYVIQMAVRLHKARFG